MRFTSGLPYSLRSLAQPLRFTRGRRLPPTLLPPTLLLRPSQLAPLKGRNWTRAIIEEVRSDKYAIDPMVEQTQLDVGNTEGGGDEGHGRKGSFFGVRRSSGGGRRRSSIGHSRRSSTSRGRRTIANTRTPGGGRSIKNLLAFKVAPASTTWEWIPLPDSFKQSAVGLLDTAQDKLRLLQGDFLTSGLMKRCVLYCIRAY